MASMYFPFHTAKPLLVLFVVLGLHSMLPSIAAAETITIDASQDTWINSGTTNNWGTWQYIEHYLCSF